MGFELPKLAWLIANPGNSLLIALVAGALLLFTPWRRFGRIVVLLVAVAGLTIGIVPVGQWLTVVLENRFAVARA